MYGKKIIYSIFFCLLSVNTFAMQLSNDLQEIVKDGKLTVAFVSPDVNKQTYAFDKELALKIANELSVTLNPVIANSHDEAVALVASKQAELAISNITRTPKRGKYVLFSAPYNNSYLALIENRNNATVTDVTREKIIKKYNQPNMKIGALEGTVFADIAKNYFPKAKLTTYTNENQMLSDIDNNKIDMAVTDNYIGKSLLKAAPQLSLSLALTKIHDWILDDAIVINTEHIHLMYWINLLLDTYEHDGTLKAMRSQYLNHRVGK